MPEIKVVNIKCGGCEAGIMATLHKAGLSDVRVDVDNQLVSFVGDYEMAKNILIKKGYPEASSKEATLCVMYDW